MLSKNLELGCTPSNKGEMGSFCIYSFPGRQQSRKGEHFSSDFISFLCESSVKELLLLSPSSAGLQQLLNMDSMDSNITRV